MKRCIALATALSAIAILGIASPAMADGHRGYGHGYHGGNWSFGVGVYSAPRYYHRPYYAYPPVVYGRPYPVYYPAPVYVQPRPSVVYVYPQPPAPVAQRAPQIESSAPAPQPQVIVVQGRVGEYLARLTRGNDDSREKAAKELRKYNMPVVVDALTAALQRDGSDDVREQAANSLSHLEARDALPALHQAAYSDPDKDVRKAASKAARHIQATYGIYYE